MGGIAKWRISSGDHRRILWIPGSRFVRSTSAQAVIPHLDRVFYTHGFPKTAKTAGGPPLNGHDYHQYMQWAGKRSVVVSPEDPEANGLAEEFHENNEHIAHIEGNIPHMEGKNHQQELYKFLRHYRATPHSSAGKAPAEVLFNRPFQVRLPQKNEPAQDPVLSQRNLEAKAKQKTYKGAKTNTKPHNIKVEDRVLLIQRQSKSNPRYTQSHVKLLTSKEHKLQQHEEPRSENGMLNDSKSSPTQSTGGMENLDTPSTYIRKILPPLTGHQP